MTSKPIIFLLSAAVAAMVVSAGMVRPAVAAVPASTCAKKGQSLAKGTNQYNTVLVKLWVFDKNSKPDNTMGFSLVRIGKHNQHIPVLGLVSPNCWTLFRLPNFGKQPMTLCVVVRGHYRSIPDPAHPKQPSACPTPTFDPISGLTTYKGYLQDT